MATSTPTKKPRCDSRDFAAPMKLPPTREQLDRVPTEPLGVIGQIAKYDPCPCGSGKKFKFCCFHGGVKSPTHDKLADALGVIR